MSYLGTFTGGSGFSAGFSSGFSAATATPQPRRLAADVAAPPVTAAPRDVAHHVARLGLRGVLALRRQDDADAPDFEDAVAGTVALMAEDALSRAEAQRLALALWSLGTPRPTAYVRPEAWRALFALAGLVVDSHSWDDVPEQMTLLRAARNENAARGWSWTTSQEVARYHAEGHSASSAGRRHASPRVFRTVAPRAALLASMRAGGEREYVVDPELLGDIEEIPASDWGSWPAPVKVRARDGKVFMCPGMWPWSEWPRA